MAKRSIAEEPPSAPPKNIVASGRTNQSIMVQWQPPPEPEHNGALRGYVLRQVPRPARAPAVEVQNLNRWTAREVPLLLFICCCCPL